MEATLRELVFKHGIPEVYKSLSFLVLDIERDIKTFRSMSGSHTPKPIPPPPADIMEFLETGTEIETEPPVPVPPPTTRTHKDKKDAHKKAIKEKYEENGAKGIIPTSLLTKDALTEWLNDGKTYWQIAEETGASDADVSTMAKLHGLQSTLSKIIAGKKQIKG